MSRYLDFYTPEKTDQTEYARFGLGSPLHDGNMPTKFLGLRGVRLDGSVGDFHDETIPERVHKALVAGEEFARRGYIFDCVVFAALMFNVEFGTADTEGIFPLYDTTDQVHVREDDTSVSLALNLGVPSKQVGVFEYYHSVIPAHVDETALYIQKLNAGGPLCISGLKQALTMYDCTVAHTVLDRSMSD